MIISAMAWAADPSLAYFEEGRVLPADLVMDAGHAIHIAAEDGDAAA
jgi:hypothetical protein